MKLISVRGMLVDASYEDPFLRHEIDNGVFTPASKVMREIDEANGDDITILVDSEGGDVFAFHAVLDKVLSYPGSITFKIGACAFSEAANFVLLSKRPVQCYPFSIVLFHSAMSTVYDGASSELRSEATILDKINEPVKAALKAYGIPDDEIEDGFRDRNALVLGAEELVRYGMATLLDDEAPAIPKVDEATSKRLAALAEANQRIAAFHSKHSVNTNTNPKAMKKSEEEIVLTEEEEKKVEETPASEEKKETPCAEEPATEEEKPVEEETRQPSEEDKPSEETEEEQPSEEEKPEAEEEEGEPELLEVIEKLKENVEELTGRMSALEEKLTEKEVELEDAKKALKAERKRRIGSLAAAVSGKAEAVRPADWPAAVKSCKGDKLEAFKKYPDLAKAWTKTN